MRPEGLDLTIFREVYSDRGSPDIYAQDYLPSATFDPFSRFETSILLVFQLGLVFSVFCYTKLRVFVVFGRLVRGRLRSVFMSHYSHLISQEIAARFRARNETKQIVTKQTRHATKVKRRKRLNHAPLIMLMDLLGGWTPCCSINIPTA